MKVHNQNLRRRAASAKGFTLLETAVALVVMMVVGIGVASAFAYAVSSNGGAGDRNAAVAIAQRTVEHLRGSDFTDASLNNGSTTQSVIINGHSYQVSTTVLDTVVSGKITLKKITVQVIPQNTNTLSSLSSGASTSNAFGSVMMVTERCSPVPGANLQ